uniref:Uncharacterized protein n=1 Tax=viral metagenome TaxID=1070528 RepID=A0A6C0IQD0_9ZZZZ
MLVYKTRKIHAVMFLPIKTGFAALCYECVFYTKKISFPSQKEKMDIYFCPFFLSDPSFFFSKK